MPLSGLRRVSMPRLFLAVAVAYLVLVYLMPMANLLSLAADPAIYRDLFTSNAHWRVLLHTITFAAQVTIVAFLIGYPIACVARMSGPRMERTILLLSTVPLWTSALARSYSWLAVLERNGPINNLLLSLGLIDTPLDLSRNTFGAFVGSVYIVVPIMILSMYGPMRSIDLRVLQSARTLGARPIQAFMRVFVPLSIPGIVSGILVVYILSLGFFISPVLLGGPPDRTWAVLIYQELNISADFQASAALAVVLLSTTVIFLVVFGKLVGFGQFTGGQARSVHYFIRPDSLQSRISSLIHVLGPAVRPLESRRFWTAVVMVALVFLLTPYFVLVPMSLSAASYLEFPPASFSLRWYEHLATDPAWIDGSVNSILVGVVAAVLAVTIGFMAALGLRQVSSRTATVLMALFLAPAMIPEMIYAVGAYFWAANFRLVDTYPALVLAHSAQALPFVIIVSATALSGLDRWVGFAARSSGAGPRTVLRRITIPLIAPSLVIAAVVAFQTSFDELVVALFMTGVHTQTLPRVMWQAVQTEINPSIAAAAVVILAFTCLLAAAGYGFERILAAARRQAGSGWSIRETVPKT